MAQSPHTGGKRGIVPGFWTAGITRRLEGHDRVFLHRGEAQYGWSDSVARQREGGRLPSRHHRANGPLGSRLRRGLQVIPLAEVIENAAVGSFSMIVSRPGCLQAVCNQCEFVGHEREQSAPLVCNESGFLSAFGDMTLWNIL
jgi:hypothetical protein